MDKRKSLAVIIVLCVVISTGILVFFLSRNKHVSDKPIISFPSTTPVQTILKELSSCDKIEISYRVKTNRDAQAKIQIDDKIKIQKFAELLKKETFKETDVNAVDGPYFMAVEIYKGNKNDGEFYLINNLLEINDNSCHLTYACQDNDIAFYCQRELGMYEKK